MLARRVRGLVARPLAQAVRSLSGGQLSHLRQPRYAVPLVTQRWDRLSGSPTTATRFYCAAPATSPKIEALVEQISSLSLLEAAELTDALKEKLGISSAMFMPAGGGAAPAAAAPADEPKEAEAEKTHFMIKLESWDTSSKIKIIKEVRALAGLGLKEAKEMVEKAPVTMMTDIKKEEAEAIKEKLIAAGAVVTLE